MFKKVIQIIQFIRLPKQQKVCSKIKKVIPVLSAIQIYHSPLTDMNQFLNKITKKELIFLFPIILIFHLSLHSLIRTPFKEQIYWLVFNLLCVMVILICCKVQHIKITKLLGKNTNNIELFYKLYKKNISDEDISKLNSIYKKAMNNDFHILVFLLDIEEMLICELKSPNVISTDFYEKVNETINQMTYQDLSNF